MVRAASGRKALADQAQEKPRSVVSTVGVRDGGGGHDSPLLGKIKQLLSLRESER